MENQEETTRNLKPLNRNMTVLQKHFSHCLDKDGNFLLEKFQAELAANEVEISKESYGLDWLGKSYARLLASDPATTRIKEDTEFNAQPENKDSQNLLIKGDNLEVLKHLSHAYHEKIKMIYIDPPYNTGGDGFVYQDDRKFTASELESLAGVSREKAERILSFTQSKSNSHSAWLTFMYPRLYIAKQLLTDDGVIFISIDDNEVAQLRLLMDEIFGEENFVAELVWQRAYAPKNDAKYVSNSHEYILVYTKLIDDFTIGRLPRSEEADARYKNPDNDPRGVWKPSDISVKTYTPNNDYKIKTPSGRIVEPPAGRCWSLSEKAFSERLRDNRIWFGSDGNNVPSMKRFLTELKFDGMAPNSLLFYKDVGHSQEGSKEVVNLFNDQASFDGPKPLRLLNRLLLVGNISPNDLILDFFAGSGTTGDAVMQLNAEDGGKRKFILAQLPEEIDPKKSKVAHGFVTKDLGKEEATIFEITKERLIRAAKKLKEEKPEQTEGQDLGFKVYETPPIWENYHQTLQFGSEDLFDFNVLSAEDVQSLLLTWKTFDGSPLTEEIVKYDLSGYTGHYVNERLYLMDQGFTTDHLVSLLQQIDAEPDFNPRSIIAFGYYFQSKNLRELYESLKSYKNRKDIEIDFITRY